MAIWTNPWDIAAFAAGGGRIAGAKLYFFVSGTTDLAEIWSNSALSASLNNPVDADSEGEFPPIYIRDDQVYDIVKTGGGDAGDDHTAETQIQQTVVGYTVTSAIAGLEGTVRGCVPSNAADADHDLTFTSGHMFVASSGARHALPNYTKQFDAAFAAGTAAGALGDGVSLPTSGTMHVFAIYNTSTFAVDYYGDTDINASNVPTGNTVLGRVFSFTTDSSANINAFTAHERGGDLQVDLSAPIRDLNALNPGSGGAMPNRAEATLSVPDDFSVMARVSIFLTDASATIKTDCLMTTLDQADTGPGAINGVSLSTLDNNGDPVADTAFMTIKTSTDKKIAYRLNNSDSGINMRIFTLGWVDSR